MKDLLWTNFSCQHKTLSSLWRSIVILLLTLGCDNSRFSSQQCGRDKLNLSDIGLLTNYHWYQRSHPSSVSGLGGHVIWVPPVTPYSEGMELNKLELNFNKSFGWGGEALEHFLMEWNTFSKTCSLCCFSNDVLGSVGSVTLLKLAYSHIFPLITHAPMDCDKALPDLHHQIRALHKNKSGFGDGKTSTD